MGIQIGDRLPELRLRVAKPGGIESRLGLGLRSQRYAAIVEDGVVKSLHVEEPRQLEVSSAEAILREL